MGISLLEEEDDLISVWNQLRVLSKEKPLLILLENAQWIDAVSLEKLKQLEERRNQEKWQLIFYSGRASASFLRQLLGELEGRETVVSTRVDQFWSKWKSCSLERGTGSNRAGSDGADGRMEWRQSVLAVQLYRRVERKWKFRTLAWYHFKPIFLRSLGIWAVRKRPFFTTYLVFISQSPVYLGRIDGYRASCFDRINRAFIWKSDRLNRRRRRGSLGSILQANWCHVLLPSSFAS